MNLPSTSGRKKGRPSAAWFHNKRDEKRLQITMEYDLVLAIAVGDEEAVALILRIVTEAAHFSEDRRS